jgi:uncharacterized membrane protein
MSRPNAARVKKHHKESLGRSIIKTVSYRVVVIALDFTVIYLLTHRVDMALGFMAISNVYTTAAYFFHERIWDKIPWGK